MASTPSASAFSLPLPLWNQPLGPRLTYLERRKRKKHSDAWTDDDEDAGETTDATDAGHSLVLTPNESHQYRIAGLSFNQELPGGVFPHGPPKEKRSSKEAEATRLVKALSALSPPIYPPQASAQQGNIRYQHLSAMTAILHRCLLQGDYIRAGRAWGLILRESFKGLPMDVRTDDRWGIGAEILLRQGQQEAVGIADQGGLPETPNTTETPPLPFTKKGFADAKEYYERLILHHPYTKSAPNAISSLHFYPAMFGLWIYVIQEEGNVARQKIDLRHDDSSDELSPEDDSSPDREHHEGSADKKRSLIATTRARELENAQQIAARMDELLVSPPYMDSPELLELRGMVSLWIGDLFVSSLQTRPDSSDGSDPDAMTMDELPNTIQARREQRLANEKRQAELQKSLEFFEKAKKRGRSVAYNLEHFHIDDDSPFG
ncbi:uncharacterized protein PFLUO_LOCUS3885 [Penicillium psychrofluorescens]|uniref:uncharacterized protein n=1 Tax=Penicillium psychrofluorescens TaxID=3158075 RepID=UPI003CCC9C30